MITISDMKRALLTFMTKEDLITRYAILHERKIFSKSWKKEEIARAIGEFLNSLGFKPFQCYCGITLNSYECVAHFKTCTKFKEHGDRLPVEYEPVPPWENLNLAKYFHEPMAWEITNLEHKREKQSIEDGLPDCQACGTKFNLLQQFDNREMLLVKCGQCNTISIIDKVLLSTVAK